MEEFYDKEIRILLNMDQKDSEIVDGEPSEDATDESKKVVGFER